jgi:hypothetical protein
MARRSAVALLAAVFLSVGASLSPALADDDKFTKQELDQMLAPIALYPDELLTNVLIASTYPLDVVEAERWRGEPANAKLKGDALAKALDEKDWDPSIKALVQFPDVLKTMSEKLDWTQKLGDAFLAQQDEVMDEIQLLRRKADAAGNLESNDKQKVTKDTGGGSGEPVYVIEQAAPDVVYVPTYQPAVYGDWWYPDYPPYYWPYPGARFIDGYFWGAGIAIAGGIWGWNHFDWHRHDIDIDVNKWNNINRNRNKIVNNKWEHHPDHRGPVPYRSKDARDKFKQAGRDQIGNKDFRGRDRAEIESKLKDTDHSQVRDKLGDRDGPKGDLGGKDLRDRGGDRIKDKAGVKDRAGQGPKAANRIDKGGKAKNISRDIDRPKARKPPSGAFDVKRGADVRKAASRGHASRVQMASRGGGRAHRGGGGRGGGRRR